MGQRRHNMRYNDYHPVTAQGGGVHPLIGHPRFSDEEIARRGQELYDRSIRQQVEGRYDGKIIVIDVETGEYEIDDDGLAANRRAMAKHPGAALYGLRIGYDAVEGFGGGPRRVKQ
jgi:hypothetical protein